ncbi:MAG: metallophosphoesterase [Mycoplasmataceae bacterium]|nr:metallophosphoesterase [Mycoplasmataceae bacterium]
MKINVIADVHGRYNALKELIKIMPGANEMVLLGDLIDRGRNNVEVMEFVIKNNIKSVLGNHDFLFLYYMKEEHDFFSMLSKDDKNIVKNAYQVGHFGFIEEIDEKLKDGKDKFIQDVIQYIKAMPVKIEYDDIYISHTPFIKPVEDIVKVAGLKELMFNREEINSIPDKFHVFGHMGRQKNYTYIEEEMKESKITSDYNYKVGNAVCIDGMKDYLIGANIDTETHEIEFYIVNGNREWNDNFGVDYNRTPKELKSIEEFIDNIELNRKKRKKKRRSSRNKKR